jgi:hypothetical protein
MRLIGVVPLPSVALFRLFACRQPRAVIELRVFRDVPVSEIAFAACVCAYVRLRVLCNLFA